MGLLIELITLIAVWLIKYFQANGIKHIVGDNHDGTVTVITQVTIDSEIRKEWNETANSRFLNEMKRDHKVIGKEFIKEYKVLKS
jgi:hypothetical protein